MRLYFNGLLPLVDTFDTGHAPQCKQCSQQPFNRINHVLKDGVEYQEDLIRWQCERCGHGNRYQLTNKGVRTINRIKRDGREYTLCAVIAKVDAANHHNHHNHTNYHAWRVKIYAPRLKQDKKRGYSALNYKYMGYVNDSQDNNSRFKIVDGHNKRSTSNLKRSLSLLLNSGLGFYEELCEGCNGIVDVSPAWKNHSQAESEPIYCIQCYTNMLE